MLKSQNKMMELAQAANADGMPKDLLKWLTDLKLLIGVPFNYLVPDNDFLPPESLRFFHIDENWVNALTDGAHSIGRHYTGTKATKPTLPSEVTQAKMASDHPTMNQRNVRRKQLSLKEKVPSPDLITAPRTGFILRSDAVKSWPNMDVAGYEKGKSPYDCEQGNIDETAVTPMTTLRLVKLSSTVMLGIFEGTLYELILHQPPEAIHFGFQSIGLDTTHNKVTKDLRVPTSNWDDPNTKYDTSQYPKIALTDVFVSTESRVLDMMVLSQKLGSALAKTRSDGAPVYFQDPPSNSNYKDHLISSDFGLEMVHGAGLVSYINTTANLGDRQP